VFVTVYIMYSLMLGRYIYVQVVEWTQISGIVNYVHNSKVYHR